MKRFYKKTSVAAAEGGFAVLLDGKPIRTPTKARFAVPGCALAEAIAAEWQAQGEEFNPAELHLTRLAGTAIDLVAPRRAQIVAEIANYAGTDLLCYRAGEPPELAARQLGTWQPLLDWAASRYAKLAVTQGVSPVAQDPKILRAYEAAVADYDSMQLAALYLATSALGSLVLALALIEGRIDADAAFAAAQLDEDFQIERWGLEDEAAKRRAALQDDIRLAARFAALHRDA
ncbi:MAG TPA: ATP12 family protein [Stellaceae bacterium]|jgi:chaperone required for assembly of F1-ATPase|nr:ATP12 family protein [Stellaceae bacterium]